MMLLDGHKPNLVLYEASTNWIILAHHDKKAMILVQQTVTKLLVAQDKLLVQHVLPALIMQLVVACPTGTGVTILGPCCMKYH